jgi:hypothetical protein
MVGNREKRASVWTCKQQGRSGARACGTKARVLTQTYVQNDFGGEAVWRREKAGILGRTKRFLPQEIMDKGVRP